MANFCTNCGAKVRKEDNFCTNCGTKIDKSDIKVYVDLEGLTEGTYTKEIIVKGLNPLAIYKAKRTEATVVISKQ